MDDNFTPLLTSTPWNSEWKELQKRRRPPDDASYWDKRASTFRTKDAPSDYTDQFLAYAAVQPGETVFDMGCGNGALALPLAAAGHPVVAADFSQGMLDDLHRKAEARGLTELITPLKLSWEDNWAAVGVQPDSCDVALASRSVATADLAASLIKLSAVARRRACATLTTGPSPHVDPFVFEALGLPVPRSFDYLYALMVLTQLGYLPEVRIIHSQREKSYDNLDEAADALEVMIRKFAAPTLAPATAASIPEAAAIDRSLEALRPWLEENLVPNPLAGEDDGHGSIEKALRLRRPCPITWAFLSWDTSAPSKPLW